MERDLLGLAGSGADREQSEIHAHPTGGNQQLRYNKFCLCEEE
jgi:hypothetical protein